MHGAAEAVKSGRKAQVRAGGEEIDSIFQRE